MTNLEKLLNRIDNHHGARDNLHAWLAAHRAVADAARLAAALGEIIDAAGPDLAPLEARLKEAQAALEAAEALTLADFPDEHPARARQLLTQTQEQARQAVRAARSALAGGVEPLDVARQLRDEALAIQSPGLAELRSILREVTLR
jgi:hypothetical protein